LQSSPLFNLPFHSTFFGEKLWQNAVSIRICLPAFAMTFQFVLSPVALTARAPAQGIAVEHRNEGSNIAQICFGLRFGEQESEALAERQRERSRSETTGTKPQAERPPIIRHWK
jgi:hypothetical protein